MSALPTSTEAPTLSLRLPTWPVRWTYALIGLNLLTFGISYLNRPTVLGLGALIPLAVLHGQAWRMVTAAFLHSGFTHLGFNMYALYALGREVERLFGPHRFLLLYAYALTGGSLFVVAFAPLHSATIGASGAILGVMGAMMAYLARYSKRMPNARRELLSLSGWAVLNLMIGLMPNVSLWGHLGGLLFGLVAGWILTPRYHLETIPHPHLVIEPLQQEQIVQLLALLGSALILLISTLLLR